jgi:hypothetical protein
MFDAEMHMPILAVCLLEHAAELGARSASSEQPRPQAIAVPVRS